MQEAWLAVAEGRKPDSAVRKLLRRETKHQGQRVDIESIDGLRVRALY